MKNGSNFINTSTRVLETLKILSKKDASVQDIVSHLEKADPNNRTYTGEVVLKYINTLKAYGYKFSKEKDKYVLLNPPNQFDFNKEELKLLLFMPKIANAMPEKKIKEETVAFANMLTKRYSDRTLEILKTISEYQISDVDICYKKYETQIKEYEKYCNEQHKIKLCYKAQPENEVCITAEPMEIVYKPTEVFLRVYNPVSALIQDINLDKVVGIKQMPIKSSSTNLLSSATFKLKGDLAKAYTIKEHERLIELDNESNIIILNKTEDKTQLLKRLMRYGSNCEVLTPKTLREEMAEMIDKTLKNYI